MAEFGGEAQKNWWDPGELGSVEGEYRRTDLPALGELVGRQQLVALGRAPIRRSGTQRGTRAARCPDRFVVHEISPNCAIVCR
jgi:hypothetical protein